MTPLLPSRPTTRPRTLALAVGAMLALATAISVAIPMTVPGARAEEEKVTELHPNGKPKLTYTVDDTGRRDGACVEYYLSGKPKIRSKYKNGKLHGMYSEFQESGRPKLRATYKNGELHGPYNVSDEKGKPKIAANYVRGELDGKYEVYRNGEKVTEQRWSKGEMKTIEGVEPYTKSKDDIYEAVEEIFNAKDPLEDNAADPKAAERGEALRVLRIYRYLCDVPHDGMYLTQEMNDYGDAAAALCERIGRLDHTPPNPGMPEAEYKFGYKGTSSSNLHRGGTMVDSVHAYMDDSDASNIDRVGHRRWCINPRMLKTGFGSSGKFTAMMAHDRARSKVPEFDYVAYPPPGHMPSFYFGERHAWSVSLNPTKWSKPDKAALKARIYPMDEEYVRETDPIPLDYQGLSIEGMGLPWCIIFRPKTLDLDDGARYWVEIEGLERGGKPETLRYMVEFFEL